MKSVAEADALLTAAGQPFEIDVVDVDGRPTRVWRNAPEHLGEVIAKSLEVGGDRDYIVLGDERMSHATHHDQVMRLAAALVSRHGVRPGDRVAIAMRNLPEWSVSFYAATLAGAIAVPLNAFWNGAELEFAIDDCSPRVLIADGERIERLIGHERCLASIGAVIGTRLDDRKTADPLPAGIIDWSTVIDESGHPAAGTLPALDADMLATIFYTSGTTSHPKGVLGTHRNVCQNLISLRYTAARIMGRMGMTPAPGAATDPPAERAVTLVPVPLFHATGCHSNLIALAWSGGTIVMMRRWDPEQALALIEQHGVTNVSGVPAMAWDIVNSPNVAKFDLSSLRSLGGGGSAAPPELLRRIRQIIPTTGSGTGYGLTESSSLTASIGGPDYDAKPSSVGAPVPICEVRIVGETGTDVPTGEVGEIWIKGPTVVRGYWQRPEDTAATFTDGWLHSGDLGRFDDDGFLYIVDRAKDMVIRGGENISSIEVEQALYTHPAVAEAGVFSVPHPVLGEEVGAVVYLKPGATATVEELRDHAASQLAPYKVPAHIWIATDPLPRGATGKLLKREIRATHI